MNDLHAQLDGLYASAREDNADEDAVSKLLYGVAELGGTATLEAVAEAVPGVTASTIQEACEKPTGDKRKQPLLRATEVAGARLLVLTSAGWSATGRTSKREQKPDASRLSHLLAPQRVQGEMKAKQAKLRASVADNEETVRISVGVSASALNDFGAKCSAAAWGRIQGKTMTDADGLVGTLTNKDAAPRPDAVIIEEWPARPGGLNPFAQSWTGVPEWDGTDPGVLCELTLLLEIETSQKSTDALKDKIRRLNTAMKLGVGDVVIWAVDDLSIATRVWRRVLAEDPQNGPARHRFVPLNRLDGSGGMSEPMPEGSQGWWITRF